MVRLQIPRQTIDKFSKIKDLDDYIAALWDQVQPQNIDVSLNRVLCGVYLTYEKTTGGLILPTDTKAEDIWQGKAAYVIKVGASAFKDSSEVNFNGFSVQPGDWVTFKIGNASQLEINQYPCRIVLDHFIEAKITDPRMITS